MSENSNNQLEGGYRHVLRLAWPMILSTSSLTIMRFVDGIFVARYSQDALAASFPAGISSFVFISFFLGTTGYVSTFVAQYHGAGREQRIGPAVWQGVYLGLVAMVLMWTLYPLAEVIMNFAGHAQPVRVLEIKYFRILVLGGGFVVIQAALNGFYIGRGKMHTVMSVNFVTNGVNIVLDYCWIFGKFGFTAWGLVGAGWATVTAQALGALIMCSLFLARTNRSKFATTTNIGLDKNLFRRLLRYGAPNGLHFCVDISAFAFFIFLVGRIGSTELATTNAVFRINHLAFMPMIGLAIATSTLVGQFLGRNRPDLAEKSTSTALKLVIVYMIVIATVFVLFPHRLLGLFKSGQPGADFTRMIEIGTKLLVFVALYSLFDGVAITYSAALKGAGDTRFSLCLTASLVWSLMALPVWLATTYFNGGLKTSFTFILIYAIVLACGFYLRYRGGKWKNMRVIEPEEAPPVAIAEGPLVET